MGISDIIKNAIQITGHHPFLFVGSGISKRYLNTEKWDELLKVLCTEFSGNDFQYNIYANEVDAKDYYGMQPAIANLLEKDYSRAVLSKEKYNSFRTAVLMLKQVRQCRSESLIYCSTNGQSQ